MRRIVKGPEPRALVEYRLGEDHPTYADFRQVDTIRLALLRDQGWLCAYCMRSLNEPEAHVEHWQSQGRYAPRQLDWSNMLGVCPGGRGKPPHLQHCDTSKGEREISINPLQDIEPFLHYDLSGRLLSSNPEWQKDIDETLQLNIEGLKEARKNAVDGMIQALSLRHPGRWPREALQRAVNDLTGQPGDRLQAYAGILLYYLRERIRRDSR